MSETLTFPRNATSGNLYAKTIGGVVRIFAFKGDPALYDGDWYRKTVTVSSTVVARRTHAFSNADVSFTMTTDFNLSGVSGTWTLTDVNNAPFRPPVTSYTNGYAKSWSTITASAALSGFTMLNGKTLDGTPTLSFINGLPTVVLSQSLGIKVTNLGQWSLILASQYSMNFKVYYRTTDMAPYTYTDVSLTVAAAAMTFTKTNSLAAGHSVLGSYGMTGTPATFSVLSGSFTVAA